MLRVSVSALVLEATFRRDVLKGKAWPFQYAQTDGWRSAVARKANRHLAYFLTFTAGAVAGGFGAVQQYTSHMASGIVSHDGQAMALGGLVGGVAGVAALLSFLAGATQLRVPDQLRAAFPPGSEYALPLLEADAATGVWPIGPTDTRWFYVPRHPVMLLCCIMGRKTR